ncbi:unnamed protein product [Amoebophrya sp. A120]|nr:unnamed protein product [Amoebophrya sp. A120]|eukprot:GSA120T00022136001.1
MLSFWPSFVGGSAEEEEDPTNGADTNYPIGPQHSVTSNASFGRQKSVFNPKQAVNTIARGTYFIRNKFLAKTASMKNETATEREIPEGYCMEDYDCEFILTTLPEVSRLYHAEYLPLGCDCSLLKVYPDAVPRGMDVYSLLSTMYNSKFSSFLPQFGCDFLDGDDCSYAIILEPAYPQFISVPNFIKDFAKLKHNHELKNRLLARIFGKLFSFLILTHEENCMGWFDYVNTMYLEAGYENLKFFHLGFTHDSNKTRMQKIAADFMQCADLLDKILLLDENPEKIPAGHPFAKKKKLFGRSNSPKIGHGGAAAAGGANFHAGMNSAASPGGKGNKPANRGGVMKRDQTRQFDFAGLEDETQHGAGDLNFGNDPNNADQIQNDFGFQQQEQNNLSSMIISQEEADDGNYGENFYKNQPLEHQLPSDDGVGNYPYGMGYGAGASFAGQLQGFGEQDQTTYAYGASSGYNYASTSGANNDYGHQPAEDNSNSNYFYNNQYNSSNFFQTEGQHNEEPGSEQASLNDVNVTAGCIEVEEEEAELDYPHDNLLQHKSLMDFRKTLHFMTKIEEAVNHPFLIEYEAKNRIDLLHKLFKRNGKDNLHLSQNLCDSSVIMGALQRLEKAEEAKNSTSGPAGASGGRKSTGLAALAGGRSSTASSINAAAGALQSQSVLSVYSKTKSALGAGVGRQSTVGKVKSMKSSNLKQIEEEPGAMTRRQTRTTSRSPGGGGRM